MKWLQSALKKKKQNTKNESPFKEQVLIWAI